MSEKASMKASIGPRDFTCSRWYQRDSRFSEQLTAVHEIVSGPLCLDDQEGNGSVFFAILTIAILTNALF